MLGYRMRAPAIVGAYTVKATVADTYEDRRRWSDWLRYGVAGSCLIVEHEGTMIRQELHFSEFGDALAFYLRWGGDGIEPMAGDVVWMDIEKHGRRYSPMVYVAGWTVYG